MKLDTPTPRPRDNKSRKAPLTILVVGFLAFYGAVTSTYQPPASVATKTFGADLRLASGRGAGLPILTGHGISGPISRADLPGVDLAALEVDTVADMDGVFQAIAFDLAAVRTADIAVPRVYLAALPGDFAHAMPVSTRKAHFLRTILPLVLAVNEEIQRDRVRLPGDARGRARLPP